MSRVFGLTTTILSIMIFRWGGGVVAYQILGIEKTSSSDDDNAIITVPLEYLDTTLTLHQQTRESDGSVSMAGTPWPASYELANYITHPSKRMQFVDQTVLELGSGLGICSIAASLLSPRKVIATDGSSTALGLLRRNVGKYNKKDSTENNSINYSNIIQVQSLEWGRPIEEEVRNAMQQEYPDILLASDVVYPRSDRLAFKQTVQEFCGPNTLFLLGHTWRGQPEDDDAYFDSIGIPYTISNHLRGSRPAVSILEFRHNHQSL